MAAPPCGHPAETWVVGTVPRGPLVAVGRRVRAGHRLAVAVVLVHPNRAAEVTTRVGHRPVVVALVRPNRAVVVPTVAARRPVDPAEPRRDP